MSDAPDQLDSAVPPRLARILSFAAIIVSGLFGGMIGWSLVRLQVSGDTTTPQALGALVGSVAAASGVAIVSTLVMRAMNEWRSIQHGVNPRTGERLKSG